MTRILSDDDKREDYPLYDGLFAYFPAALLEIARWSKVGNDKHNPGEPLHWAREKSTDHENKILRHLLDARETTKEGFLEAVPLAWRALALLQTLLEEQGWAEGANSVHTKEQDGKEKSGGFRDGISAHLEAATNAKADNYRSPRQVFQEETQRSEGPHEVGAFWPLPRVEHREVLGLPTKRTEVESSEVASGVRSEGLGQAIVLRD